MLCCLLIALAATPMGAWLMGAPRACCGARGMVGPLASAFALALGATLLAWLTLWLLLPGFDLFRPICRVGAFLSQAV